jgi:pimeloyl-ACP methyl ester carboxylesterase
MVDSMDRDELTAEDLFKLDMPAMEGLVESGEHDELLRSYFGTECFDQIRSLKSGKRRAKSRLASNARVILLPGVMGSLIGLRNRGDSDIVWVNPVAIGSGEFKKLRLDSSSGPKYGARGAIPLYYTLLSMRLSWWYGHTVEMFDFDWRLSLQDLGAALAKRLDEVTEDEVYIVAHSMGGLVARRALAEGGEGADKVKRVIQLGTPNGGSFAPVQVLRGEYEFVNFFLGMDVANRTEDLLGNVASTFPGLCQLMPAPARYTGTFDLYDPANWPAKPAVQPQVLANAKQAWASFPDEDPRLFMIAGVEQRTVNGVARKPNGDFEFRSSPTGDGTVPLEFAVLKNRPNYLVKASHSGMLNRADVAEAVDDIIRLGSTGRLDALTPRLRSATERVATTIVDPTKARAPFGSRSPRSLKSEDLFAALRSLQGPLDGSAPSSPSMGGLASGSAAGSGDMRGVVVSRRRRRLRIVIAHGDVTRAPSIAHMLGVFEDMPPGGAAAQYDEALDGMVGHLAARRFFQGAKGQNFVLPMLKRVIPAEMLVFCGLGRYPEFCQEVLQEVTRQLIGFLVKMRVNELATVIVGGASLAEGTSADDSLVRNLESMLIGTFHGLREEDPDHEFQKLTICVRSDESFRKVKNWLYQTAASPLFDDIEVEFDVVVLPPPADSTARRAAVSLTSNEEAPVTLFVTVDPMHHDLPELDPEQTYKLDLSVLPSAGGTSFRGGKKEFSASELTKVLRAVKDGAPNDPQEFSDELARIVLPDALNELTEGGLKKDRRVQLFHNPLASLIPWESISFGGGFPAVDGGGFSRRYQSTQPGAMFSELRRRDPKLRVLLVYNPTGDLDGAEQEGERLMKLPGQSNGRIEIESLHGEEATQAEILARLDQGDFDVLHYAGHAAFAQGDPERSGLLCADEKVLSGRNLRKLNSKLPPLVVFNACESARTRKRVRGAPPLVAMQPAQEASSAAEAILNAGILCFVGTYWPVGDEAAGLFAEVFYKSFVAGAKSAPPLTVGEAMLAARQAIKAADHGDWANYMLYGDPSFRLKDIS